VIDGRGGDDVLLGGRGDDVLRGGPGRDIADGGSGVDTASYREANAGVTVLLGEGRAAGQGVDRLRRIERVRGSGHHDVLVGDEAANSIWGLGGADEVVGMGGDDLLFGGSGRDELDGGMGTDACEDPAPTVYRSCESQP
jgi:Ca2+-binding RTX toxin-like protein